MEENSSNIEYLEEQDSFFIDSKIIDFTEKEHKVFSYLYFNKNNTVSKEVLANILELSVQSRSLDIHISNIRKKLGEEISNPKYLKVIYGHGIRLDI